MSKELNHWVKRISEQEIPIFKYTVNAINDVVADEDTSTAELAQVILQDATLTARILRLANSISYNPTGSPINTISRAIVFIGFDLVRELSLSLAVIEALLNKKNREHQLQLMARAFHAAVQARAFAIERDDDAPEEVFIAALLYHIGEMAFASISCDEADEISKLMEERGFQPAMAQREVLGFTFDQLTVGLTQDWHLSDLLHSAINNPSLSNPRIRNIVYSQELAERTEVSWDGKKVAELIKKIAKHIDMDSSKTKDWLCDNAQQAAQVAEIFGAGSIIEFLPIPDICKADDQATTEEEDLIFTEPDPLLQLSVLRDLSRLLEEKPNLNLILEIILEGIYRGIGMDRVLFAVITPDKKMLRGKHALGHNSLLFTEMFAFDITDKTLFSLLLKKTDAVWIKDTQAPEYAKAVNADMRNRLACKAFFASPLVINNTPIGLIYADRQSTNRPLDAESFESFSHFCHQAHLAISHLSPRKG